MTLEVIFSMAKNLFVIDVNSRENYVDVMEKLYM